MITSKEIKNRSKAEPFVPFRIVTSRGEKYDVSHPDLVFVGKRDIHVGFASKYDPTVYQDVVRIAMEHVTALEDIPQKGKK